MSEEAEAARRKAVANERAKLLANALDRASTACVTVGMLAPMAAFLYGIGSAPVPPLGQIVGGALAWLAAAIVLHILARTVLGSIK